MRITFLSTLIPPQMEEEVRKHSQANMQDAANALEWHIYEGLTSNVDEPIRIFNVLPVGSYPQYYTKPVIQDTVFCTASCTENRNIGFCNIKLIRKVLQPNSIYKALLHYYESVQDPGVLIIYTASASFMLAVAKLKKRIPELKTCCIVADLPNYSNLSSNKGLLLKAFIAHRSRQAYDNLGSVDYFVLLTKHMAEYMKISKPYCVMEGIATETDEVAQYPEKKTIMYSGTLHRRFGVLNLLKAFQNIEGAEYELIICGVGDSEAEIRKAAIMDKRIRFLGQLKREEVLRVQKESRVLVNPRQNTEEFTKYSFPSKDMEYLSSGIPTIAYKLDGIPDEYGEYLIYPKDNSLEALQYELERVCEMPFEEWRKIGLQGRLFVQKGKNAKKQMKRVLEMIEGEGKYGV